MKSILLSIKPEGLVNILNGEKTIEIRKKFPKDYVGWVYIYCTKDYKHILFENGGYGWRLNTWSGKRNSITTYNGKVIARFYCDKVEDTFIQQEESFSNEIEKTLENSCLTYDELWDYVQNDTFYKIHISQLEIFDRPRELSEFTYEQPFKGIKAYLPKIVKAPQNYCYVEGEE